MCEKGREGGCLRTEVEERAGLVQVPHWLSLGEHHELVQKLRDRPTVSVDARLGLCQQATHTGRVARSKASTIHTPGVSRKFSTLPG